MAWLESEVDALRMDEARERQARRRRDNRGDSDLRHDQRPSEILRQTSAPCALDAAGNDFDNVGSGSLPAWQDAKEHSGDGRHGERHRDHRSIQRNVAKPRQRRRCDRHHHPQEHRSQSDAEDAPKNEQHDCFGQQLPYDATPRRAERGANGDFTPPRSPARRQHSRDIDAGDQQDANHGCREHDERRPEWTRDLVVQTDERDAKLSIVGPLSPEPRRDCGHLLLRLRKRHTGPKSADGLKPESAATPFLCARLQWHPRVQIACGKLKRLRQHADDGVRDRIQSQDLAHRADVPAEFSLPEAVAEHDDRGLLFGRGEQSSRDRLGLNDAKKLWCGANEKELLGVADAGHDRPPERIARKRFD
jgi:hypothetical protein